MLPRETDIAERFNVSRGVARECIRGLEERGLISVRHGKGATVNPPSAWNEFDPDVLGALLEGPKAVEVLSEYRVERALPEHQRILSAIESGQAEEARAAMRDHMETVEGYLREHAAEQETAGAPTAAVTR